MKDLVTYRQFSTTMAKRGLTVAALAEQFKGKIDDPRGFFERAMSCKAHNPETGRTEDRGDVVIPYHSVLKFYFQELHYLADSKKKPPRMAVA